MKFKGILLLILLVLVPRYLEGQAELAQEGFFEYQMRGELVGPPLWIPGLGVLATTNDRRANLYSPGSDVSLHWPLSRLPQGPTTTTAGLLALVPLGNGRAQLINLQGYSIKTLLRPSLDEGFWAILDGGRILYLSSREFIFLSPNGTIIAKISHTRGPLTLLSIRDEGMYCQTSQGTLVLATHDGRIRDITQQVETLPYSLAVRPGRYEFEYTTSTEHFVFEGNANISFSSYHPQSGVLAWGDGRWKLFVKFGPKVLASHDNSSVGPTLSSQQSDIKELNYLVASPWISPQSLLDFFQIRMRDPRNFNWARTLLKDLLWDQSLVFAPALLGPSYRPILRDLGKKLFTIADCSWLASKLQASPREAGEILSFMAALGIDPRGAMFEAIKSTVPRTSFPPEYRNLAKTVLETIAPSLPVQIRSEYRQLLISVSQK